MLARQYFLQFNPSLLPKKIKKILQASSGRRESLPTNCAISDDDVFQSVAEDSK